MTKDSDSVGYKNLPVVIASVVAGLKINSVQNKVLIFVQDRGSMELMDFFVEPFGCFLSDQIGSQGLLNNSHAGRRRLCDGRVNVLILGSSLRSWLIPSVLLRVSSLFAWRCLARSFL